MVSKMGRYISLFTIITYVVNGVYSGLSAHPQTMENENLFSRG